MRELVPRLELVQPQPRRQEAAVVVAAQPAGGDEVGGAPRIAGGQPVAHGVPHLVVLLEPARGAAVQLRHRLGLAPNELRLERRSEETMVAIPSTVAVERHDEEVLTLGAAQQVEAVRTSGDRVAQVG